MQTKTASRAVSILISGNKKSSIISAESDGAIFACTDQLFLRLTLKTVRLDESNTSASALGAGVDSLYAAGQAHRVLQDELTQRVTTYRVKIALLMRDEQRGNSDR